MRPHRNASGHASAPNHRRVLEAIRQVRVADISVYPNYREAVTTAARHFDRAAAAGGTAALPPVHAYALCRAGQYQAGQRILGQVRGRKEFQDDADLLALLERVCRRG